MNTTARSVGHFAAWGPLLGGLPYNVFLIPLPFSYAIGVVPAALCGLVYGRWLSLPHRQPPAALLRALIGALCGAGACLAVALLFTALRPGSGVGEVFLMLGVHGTPAGALAALLFRRRPRSGCADQAVTAVRARRLAP